MTTSQRIYLMADLWPSACRAQGWRVDDRELRLYVCSIAVGCSVRNIHEFRHWLADGVPIPRLLKSINDLDTDADFTAVKSLLLMLADDLRGARESGDPAANKVRQKRHVIFKLMEELAQHPAGRPMGSAGAEAYMASIMRDKFKGKRSLEELSTMPGRFTDRSSGKLRRIPSELDQLLITISRCLESYRKKEKEKRRCEDCAGGNR